MSLLPIRRLDVTTSVADGIKVAGGRPRSRRRGGTVPAALAKAPILHQDGIQVDGR